MHSPDEPKSFITQYSFPDLEPWEAIIKLIYFCLTTLASVGLGDLVPQNDFERILCIFVMVGGVATFSAIFQQVMTSIDKIKSIDCIQNYDSNQLDRFLGVLKKFNDN